MSNTFDQPQTDALIAEIGLDDPMRILSELNQEVVLSPNLKLMSRARQSMHVTSTSELVELTGTKDIEFRRDYAFVFSRLSNSVNVVHVIKHPFNSHPRLAIVNKGFTPSSRAGLDDIPIIVEAYVINSNIGKEYLVFATIDEKGYLNLPLCGVFVDIVNDSNNEISKITKELGEGKTIETKPKTSTNLISNDALIIVASAILGLIVFLTMYLLYKKHKK